MTGEAGHAGSVNRPLLGCATRAERKVETNGTHTPLAIASPVFLVAVHKLEYFANVRFVGQRIEARAWELVIVMVGMEALFGLWGVVVAPILYAYAKAQLKEGGLIGRVGGDDGAASTVTIVPVAKVGNSAAAKA